MNVLSRIKDFLCRPAFIFRRPQYVISLNVVLSAIMMIMYEPFGYRLDDLSQLIELLGFITITLIYSFLFFRIIPSYMNKHKKKSEWTIGKNIIYLSAFLFITGLSIFFYDFHIVSRYYFSDYGSNYFIERIIVDVCGTFSIGIFPLYVSYLLEKNYYLKKNLYETNYTSTNSSQSKYNGSSKDYIILKGDTKDSLEICPDKIKYIESSGNYVNIYYDEVSQERKTIRTTIKKVEEQLSHYKIFIRCHRAYIINVKYVIRFGRSEMGYKVSLDGCEDDIPISRTYLSQVKERVK